MQQQIIPFSSSEKHIHEVILKLHSQDQAIILLNMISLIFPKYYILSMRVQGKLYNSW